MIRYAVAMTIRFVCVILAVVVQGWAVWIFIAGAVLLPYFAVVLANAHDHSGENKKQAKAVAPTLTISASAFTEAANESK
jgi:1,4-dihydroxy-2-naphthoate octaprenyltransferase